MARPARNSPCPCGSGLKYKRCHEGADGEPASRENRSGLWAIILLALLVGAGAVAVVTAISGGGSRAGAARGRVWSPEHGHWHDAAAPARRGGTVPFDPRAPGPTAAPRGAPPGTPPPGKVWSPEHGHWHDVAPRPDTDSSGPPIGVRYTPIPD